MGSFIAALRRAKGMTQMDLAQALNVSDKTVSRWERGNGSPDIALIPIIADIFEISSDELLRGDRIDFSRKMQENMAGQSQRDQKQIRRFLNLNYLKFKNRSLIASGFMILGLIGAMICNLGFTRAYLGFIIALLFYGLAILLEFIFLNIALAGVNDEDFQGKELSKYKKTTVSLGKKIIYLGLILLAFTLPLVFVGDPYFGLTVRYWLGRGVLYSGIVLVLLTALDPFLNHFIIRKKLYTMDENELKGYESRYKLKKKLITIAILVVSLTFMGQWLFNSIFQAKHFVAGKVFNNFEDFKEFMEEDNPGENEGYSWPLSKLEILSDGFSGENRHGHIEYFDEEGNLIPEEEAKREALYDKDGRVVHQYIWRNQSVVLIDYKGNEGHFPLTVYTNRDLALGDKIMDFINGAFIFVYLTELVIFVVVYYRKRQRLA